MKEEKKTYDNLLRHQQAFKLLTQCDKTIIQACDEVKLLQDICKVIVKTKDYCLAWVGYAQDDDEKSVKVIAEAGLDKGYLESAKITWAKNKRGLCPTGTAFVQLKQVL